MKFVTYFNIWIWVLIKFDLIWWTGFLEMPLNDQMRLLQTSWPEVLTLSLAFRSIPVNSSNPKLQWSADFSMNEKEARECGMEELFFQVNLFHQQHHNNTITTPWQLF